MASTYLTRTPSSNGNRQKWTWSGWVKGINRSGDNVLFDAGTNGGNNYTPLFFQSDGTIRLYEVVGGSLQSYNLITNAQYRDKHGWYHIVYTVDTTQATASNRIKLYVNGEQITSFSTATYPAQNYNTLKNSTSYQNTIGCASDNVGNVLFDGSMSHVHFSDGYAYDASTFGETDSTTGEWKIKVDPTFTLGTNGFTILKDGNTITDQSSNSNNWTLGGGTLTKTEDCPSNVFATWNVLDSHYFWGAAESSWCTNGNTTARSGNSQYSSCTATLGASSGKYYWEFKYVAKSGSENLWHLGIKSTQDTATTTALGINSTDYAYKAYNGQSMSDNSSSAYGSTYAVGDIIGVALDLDNNKLYFHKNGTYQNSGVPTSGSTGTGAISIAAASTTEFGVYVPAFSWNDGSSYGTNSVNFGNGYFGTTAVSSAGTNASNNGIFEYDVPAGYTALSTKGLNL
jgi:hypothetical protein